jgi:FkbM family methyltransferase
MLHERWTRRVKRRTLRFVSRCGYDIDKQPGGLLPYRFVKRIPLGDDPLADVKRIHGGEIRCVFDVGANVGQSAALFSDTFPSASIHSFEPDPESHGQLQAIAAAHPRVTAVNAAVGNRDEEASFFVNEFRQTNSLLKPLDNAGQYLVGSHGLDVRNQVQVRVITLDGYCAERGIEHVDFLKLDTQGYELRVLDGASRLLGRQAVPLIYLEVGFVPLYEDQPMFPQVYQYLYDRGYRLVWLYERSFHTHLFAISANALFVHERVGSRLAPAQQSR